MKLLIRLTLLVLLLPAILAAQPEQLEGTWYGTLTQNEGGYATTYEFGLVLTIEKGYVAGKSFAGFEDIRNEMELLGIWRQGDVLRIKESKILKSQKPEFLEWCYKSADLRLERSINGKWQLQGPWWGESLSGICIPGFIRLEKAVPRA